MRLGRVLAACAAAIALAVVLGTGSASATALCKSSTNPCPETEIHPSNTAFEMELAKPEVVLDTDTEDVECEEASVKGEWETDGSGEYAGGSATELEFLKCETTKLVACTVTASNLPYKMAVGANGGGNGTVSLTDGGGGKLLFNFECGAALNCAFPATALSFELTGGTPATATLEGESSGWSGSACPKTSAQLKGTFEVTAPASLFIVSEVAPPVLCAENKAPCPAGKAYGVPTALTAEFEAESRFVYTYLGENREPTCKFSKLSGETTEAGKPLRGKITPSFETCGGGTCNVTAQGTPYKIEIDRTGGGNGSMRWSQLTGSEPTFKIKCGLTEECVYHVSSIKFDLTGDLLVPKLRSAGKVSLTGSSPGCSTTATWRGLGAVEEVRYKFTGPTALFVRS